MAVWSSLALKNIGKNVEIARGLFISFKNVPKTKAVTYVPVRSSHERTMIIKPSEFKKNKMKDMVYLYLAVGAIPLLSIILYCNIFIGPATLAVIPEGYDPKPWEYHQHPITRFFARYLVMSPQEAYERSLHTLHVENEKRMLGQLEKKVKDLIKERRDYQAWYFEKAEVKYPRRMRDLSERAEQIKGRSAGWII